MCLRETEFESVNTSLCSIHGNISKMSSSQDLKKAVFRVRSWFVGISGCPDCNVEFEDHYFNIFKHEDGCGFKKDMDYLVKLVEKGDYY
jgi:hypothetical protein